MKLTIQMPDDLYDHFVELGDKAGKRPTSVISDVLKLFGLASPYDRILVIDAGARSRIEKVLSGGHLQSADDLATRIENLTRMEIEGVALDFSVGQKRELKRLADRNGIPYEEMVRRTVKEIEPLFFQAAH